LLPPRPPPTSTLLPYTTLFRSTEFTSTAHRFRVTPIKGLSRPFSIGFLPDGNLLVTERAGRLRIVRNGVVDPRPIAGVPEVLDQDRKSTRLNSSHEWISYAVFC